MIANSKLAPFMVKGFVLTKAIVSIFFSAVILLCSLHHVSQAQSCGQAISETPAVEMWAQFRREPAKLGTVALALENYEIRHVLYSKSAPNTVVGSMTATWNGIKNSLLVDLIGVYEPFKNKGVSNYLIKRLMEQFPDNRVQKIEADLAMDNKKIFQEEYQKNPNDFQGALKKTPFYKSFAHFGFTEIVANQNEYKPENFILKITLVKPKKELKFDFAPFDFSKDSHSLLSQ